MTQCCDKDAQLSRLVHQHTSWQKNPKGYALDVFAMVN